jgi:hypothetical protein
MSIARLALPEGYEPFLKDLKQRIRTAQVRAALAVNRELVLLYWSIGRDILARQKQQTAGELGSSNRVTQTNLTNSDVLDMSFSNLLLELACVESDCRENCRPIDTVFSASETARP